MLLAPTLATTININIINKGKQRYHQRPQQ
jgi:hypothetical protein